MNAGAVLGNHYHKQTRMFFFVTTGLAKIDLVKVDSGERRSHDIESQHGLHLEPGEAHAIRFAKESTFLLLKSQPFDENNPDTFPYPVEENAAR